MAKQSAASRGPIGAKPTKSERTRERILNAAAIVLNRNGYSNTRLTEIADLAGLQVPTLYYYYPSREELIEEVVTFGMRQPSDHLTKVLGALPADVSPLDRINIAVEEHLKLVLSTSSEYASAAIRNMSQLPPSMKEKRDAGQRRYAALWAGLINDAHRAGELDPALDLKLARLLVLGTLNWIPEWWDRSRVSVDDVVRNAQRMIRSGLTGPGHSG